MAARRCRPAGSPRSDGRVRPGPSERPRRRITSASGRRTQRLDLDRGRCGRRARPQVPPQGSIVPMSGSRRVRDQILLALDGVPPEPRRRAGGHQDVEQADLADVEDPVWPRRQARLERLDALHQARAMSIVRDEGLGRALSGSVTTATPRRADVAPRPPRALGAARAGGRGGVAHERVVWRRPRSPGAARAPDGVDFAVLLGPLTSRPPIAGLTALSSSALEGAARRSP